MSFDLKDIGWNFDNTYSLLPETLMSSVQPTSVLNPNIVKLNLDLAKYLDLDINSTDKKYLSSLFSGNILPKGSNCIAQAYSGHQFGHFTNLGDGRALLIGEHINKKNNRFDIQFKGSGRTPYSRNGDGRATIESMLREYIISEAMYYLHIPTTRSLAVVTTGEKVIREREMKGAILTRVASSHIRIGTFQYLIMKGDLSSLKKLIDYTLKRHYPDFLPTKNQAVNLLLGLIEKQIDLVINWIRVGFLHGVLNTDNISLSGETIDYGPCAFIDQYNPQTVFSSIDLNGRYSFRNQEIICHWNISRFAETLIPFLDQDEKKSIDLGTNIINGFVDKFQYKWLSMMKKKFGFIGNHQGEENFIKRFLSWMNKNNADYTNTFIFLITNKSPLSDIYQTGSFINLHKEWKKRIEKNNVPKEIYLNLMNSNNPTLIPRNYLVEEALNNISNYDDYTKFNELLTKIKQPYGNFKNYQYPSSIEYNKNYKTYCGT